MEMKELKVNVQETEPKNNVESEKLKIHAGIIADYGNSENRFRIIHDSKRITKKIECSNEFSKLPSKYEIPKPYMNEQSTVLKITEKDENGQISEICVANGLLVNREFADTSVRPTALHPKTKQDVTYWSVRLAFKEAIMYLSEYYKKNPEDIDFTFDVGILLPPLEEENAGEYISGKIREINYIETIVPYELKKEFKINKIFTLPEGVASYLGVMYEEVDGKLILIDENKRFMTGYLIIIDSGAGTSDFAVILNSELVERSRDTFLLGGNTILSGLSKKIKSEYGHILSDKEKENLLKTGSFTIGDNNKINAIQEINEGKESYSAMVQKEITSTLEGLNISLQAVKGLLMCGGGALPIEETIMVNGVPKQTIISPSMSDVLSKYLHKYNPSLADVSLNGLNPRLTNITGIEYVYKYMMK